MDPNAFVSRVRRADSPSRTRRLVRPRGSFLLATIMAEAGVSVTVGSLGVRQRGGSGSRGADVGALGARAKEARPFFSPRDCAPGLGVEGCSREVEGPGAACGPFKLGRGRGRRAPAVEGGVSAAPARPRPGV